MQPNKLQVRSLRPHELALIRALAPTRAIEAKEAPVIDMLDGGMGSIRFARLESRHRSAALCTAEYTDVDGVLVSIELNIDEHGDLFELDLWKVDFSPLKIYPTPDKLTRVTRIRMGA